MTMRIGLIYLCTLIVLLILDGCFVGFIAAPQFKAALGDMLLTRFRIAPALLFYLVFPVGLLVFVSLPHQGDALRLIFYGLLFGFLAYGTYDFTNYATLRLWTLRLVVMDLIWGSFVSAAAATAGLRAANALARLFAP